MTLQQLEYIVSVSKEKSFSKAAAKCFVTQPTLSMQIQKLEETIGATIFDRSKQPVVPTEIGKQIIAQALRILMEGRQLQEIVSASKQQVSGELRVGIIPTIAPYLVPLFLVDFLKTNPAVNLVLNELPTEQIINHLKLDLLDVGILVTPLKDQQLQEQPLYYEPFVAYFNEKEPALKKRLVEAKDIALERIWLLSEGHCMRNQVIDLCGEHVQALQGEKPYLYESSSVETLRKMVDRNGGLTVLPELSTFEFNEDQQERVRYFEDPEPVREVSLVTHRHFVKISLLQSLMDEIGKLVPEKMRVQKKNRKILRIQSAKL